MLIDTKKHSPALPRLGELFVEAGIVRKEVVTESLAISKRAQLPLGRILVMSGYVSDRDVDCAVKTQIMMQQGKATRASASRLIRLVHCKKITIEEAQANELLERAFTMPFSQLGKLLLAARILTENCLLAATQTSCRRQMPLGKLLVKEQTISQELLIASINCLILVREEKINRYEAAQLLRATYEQKLSLDQVMINAQLDHLLETKAPKLCDLLVDAGFLSEADAAWALEMSMETGNRAGQMLVKAGLITDSLLETTLQLQKMLAGRTLRLHRAAQLLRLCRDLDTTLELVLAEFDKLNQVIQFLRRGKILPEQLIREIAAETPDFESNCGDVLLRKQVVTPQMLSKGARCLSFFRSAQLTEQQAIDAYKISMAQNIAPEEALRFINWDQHNRHGNHELLGKTA